MLWAGRFTVLSTALLLFACSADLPHEAPYDELAPASKQAKATLRGTVTLEGETDFSQIGVQLVNPQRTYSVETLADGAVELTGIVPGEYELRIGTRYFVAVTEPIRFEIAEEKELAPRTLAIRKVAVFGTAVSEELAGDAAAPLRRGGVSVTLTKTASIRGAKGAPALAKQAAAPALPAASRSVLSAESGEFSFDDVAAGEYTVVAGTNDIAAIEVATLTVTGDGPAQLEDIVLRPLTGFFEIVGTVRGGTSTAFTNSRNVTLKLTESNAVKMRVGQSPDGTPAGCVFGAPENYQATRPFDLGAAEGTRLVCVRYLDENGNESETLVSSIVYDATPPSNTNAVALAQNGYVTANQVLVNLTAVDTNAGIGGVVTGTTAAALATAAEAPFQPTIILPLPSQGQKTVYIGILDRAGNLSPAMPVVVTVDSVAPVVNTAGLVTLGGTPLTAGATVTATTVRLASGVAEANPLEIQISTTGTYAGVQWLPYLADMPVGLAAPADPQGEIRTVMARVRDAAGNVADLLPALTFTVDTLGPTAPDITIGGKNLAGAVSTSTVNVGLSAGGDPVWAEFAFDLGFFTALPRVAFGASVALELPAGDEKYAVYARFYDAEGNVSAIVGDTVTLDTTGPLMASATLPAFTTTAGATLTYSAVGATMLRVGLGGSCNTSGDIPYSTGTYVLNLPSEGTHAVCTVFYDGVGNASSPVYTTVTFDGTPPALTGVTLNGGAAGTSVNVVSVDLLGAGGATKMMLSESPSFAGAAWQPFAASVSSFVVSGANGVKTVYVKLADEAGNVSGVVSDTITLDTTPASNPTIVVMADVVSATTVNVQLSAGGVTEMQLSENADLSGAAWEPYAPLRPFSLSAADGTKTIYARFKKDSGVTTATISDTVVLDRTAPVLPYVLVNGGASVVGERIVTLNLSAVDLTSGLGYYKINTVNDFSAVPQQAYQPTDQYSLPDADGLHTLWVSFADRAGNYSAPASVSVRLDRAVPVVASAGLERLDGTSVVGGATLRDARVRLVSNVADDSNLQLQVTTNGSFAGIAWEPYSASKLIDLPPTGGATIAARVRDAAGHAVDLLAGVAVSVDTQAPSGTIGLLSATPTNNPVVSLSLAASETADAQVATDPGFTGAPWFAAAATTVTLSGGDGLRTIYARFRDAAGNVSDVKTVVVALDTTAPQLAAFTIAAGAFTSVRALSLAYSGIEITEVRVAEDTCSGGYATHAGAGSFSLTSAGDGLKTVAVQFRDAVGNETACLTRTITLDTLAPVLSSFVIDGGAAFSTDRAVSLAIGVTGAVDMQLSENASFSGAAWQPATSATTFLLGAGEGLKTIYARFRDGAGNVATSNDAITVDSLVPTFNALTGPAATSVTGVTLSLTATGADEMRISENADFSGASWTPFTALAPFAIGAAQGVHTVYAQLRDVAGNESMVRSISMTLDSAAPPTPVLIVQGGAYSKDALVTVQIFTDGATELIISQLADMSDAAWQPFGQVKSVSLTGGEGAKTIYVRVRDSAGNESGQASASVTLDQTPPAVTMRADDGLGALVTQTNATRYYMRLSVTDATPVTAQFSSANSFTGVAPESVQILRVWDVVAPAASAGADFDTWVRVVDAAGNATTVGPVTVHVDTVGPTAPSIALAPALTSDTTLTVTLGAVNADYVELSENVSFLTPTVLAYTTGTTHDFTPGDGTKTLYARFVDALGNYSPIVEASTMLDTAAPENPAFSIAQGDPTNDDTLDLTLSATGAAQMSVSEGVACTAAWEGYAQSKVLTLATAANMDTTKTVSVRFKDAAGNVTACLQSTRRFDNRAPSLGAPAININYGAASTNNGSVTLTLSASEADEVQVSEDSGFGDAAWLPYSTTRTFLLSAGNGTKTVHARFRDTAGNVSAGASDQIVLDTTPISTPVVSIQLDVTSATTVNVNLAASNIDEMMLSHESDFSASTGWISYQAVYPYTFPAGDGVKTLYAKFRKLSGAESVVVSDTFILDTTGPTLPAVRVNNGAAVVSNPVITLNLSAVDVTSGLATYRINTVNAFGVSDKGYQPNDVYTLAAGDAPKTLWVRYGDRANNYSAPASVTVMLDTTTPVINAAAVKRLDGTALNSGDTVNNGRIILASDVFDLTALEMQVTTNGSFAGLGWEPYNAAKVIDLTGAATLSARVRDAAGHETALLTGFILNLDDAAPALTFARTSVSPTNDLTVQFSLSSGEAADFQISESPGFSGATWSSAGTQSLVLGAGDGLRTIYARARDAAGNVSTLESAAVMIDQTPPQGAAFTVVGGANVKDRTVALTYAGIDIYEARAAEDACGGAYATHAGAGTVSLTSPGDGPKTIAVQFRDAVGNETACLTKVVTLDETAPTINTALRINGGALETRNPTVTVETDVAGAAEMQLSESISFAGAVWTPYAVTSTVVLSAGDASKSLYARYRDAAGNVSALDGASIWLDTTPPENLTVAIAEASPTRAATVNLALAAGGSPAFMQLSENIGFVGAMEMPFTTATTFALGAGDGLHTIYVRARDVAGNWSALAADTIVVDLAAPQFASFDIPSGAYTKTAAPVINLVATGADEYQAVDAAFCGGAWLPFTTSTTVTLGGADGLKSISVRYRDAAGNESACVTKTVTLDTVLPGATITLAGGSATVKDRSVAVALTADEVVEMQLSESALFSDAQWRPFTDATVWTFNGGDGARTLHARLRDRAGNLSATVSDTLTIDTVAPETPAVSLALGAALTNQAAIAVAATATGADFVRVANTASFAGAAWLTYPATITDHALTAGDGLKTVYAQFKDAAGNESAAVSANIVKDTVAPADLELAMTGASPTKNATVTALVSASGADELRLTGDIVGGATAWLSYRNSVSVNLTAGDGAKYVSAQWRDAAGNYSATISASVVLDQSAPANGTIAVGAAELTNSPGVTLTLTSAGAAEMIVANDAGFSGGNWEPVAVSKAWTLSPGDGLKAVYLKYRDAAGNESAPINDTITLDTQPPTGTSFTIVEGASSSNRTINLNLSAVGAAQVVTGNDPSFSGASWRAYAAGVTHYLTAGDGLKVVYVKYRDAALNESSPLSQVINLDTGAPTGAQLVINSGAEHTQTASITLNVNAGGAAEMAFSDDGFAFSSWEPFAPSIGYTLPGTDGTKIVYVKFRDGALNETAVVSDAIVLDRQAPTGTSVSVASGAAYTRAASVILTLAATGASEMQVSEDNSFSGVSWEPFAVTRVFALSTGEGPKNVYARFRDQAGWITNFVSDGIVFDATPPTGNSFVVNGGAAATNSRTANLTLATSEPAAEMRISENSDFSGAAYVAFASPVTYWLSAGEGTKALYLQLRDPAGNETPVMSRFVQLDAQAPTGEGVLINAGLPYAKSAAVTLSISGNGASEMLVSENAAFAGASWVPFTTAYAHTITGGDGLRTVYLRLRDGAGNYSGTVTDSITLDTSGPTAPAIAIAEKPATRLTRVTLTLAATGASQMIIGDDVAFTGRNWQPFAASAVWTVPAGDGNKTIFAKFRDDAGNETVTVSDTTALDSAAPTLQNPPLQVNAGATYVKDEMVTLTVRYVDAVSAAVSEDIAVAFPLLAVTLPPGGVHSFAVTLSTGEGPKNVYVKFYDTAGNAIIQGQSLVLDKTAPSAAQVLIDGGAAYNTSAAGASTLQLSAVDALSGLQSVRISNTNGDGDLDGATPVPYAPSKPWTLDAPGAGVEGARTVYVKFIDGAGNESATVVSDGIGYDTLAPAAGAWSLRIGEAEYSTTLGNTLALAATGATEMKISPDNLFTGAAWEPYATARSWTFSSGGDEVTKTLYVKFKDAAGNETTFYGDSITVDTQGPAGLTMTLDGGAEYPAPEATYTRDGEFEVNLGASNWAEVEVSDDVGFQSILATFPATTVFPQTVNLSAGNQTDGLKTIYARFSDAAGNTSALISRTLLKDSSLPSPTTVLINGGAVGTNVVSGIVQLTMTAGDSGSGVDQMRIANDATAVLTASPEPFNGNKLWTLANVGAGIEGQREVWIQVSDKAGNYSAPVSDTIRFDTKAPVVAPVPIVFTTPAPSASRTVAVSFDVTDATEVLLGNDLLFTGRAWEPFSPTRAWTFGAGGDGVTQTLYAVFRDASGNQTSVLQNGMVIDDVAPSAPALVLKGGAEYTVQNPSYTQNTEMWAEASANGWTTVEFATDAGFSNIIASEPSVAMQPITLNHPDGSIGTKTIFARFKDDAGNVSATVFDSLVLDNIAPVFLGMTINGRDPFEPYMWFPITITDPTGDFAVTVNAIDEHSGVTTVDLDVSAMSRESFSYFTQPFVYTYPMVNPNTNNPFALDVYIQDPAGNTAYVTASNLRYRNYTPAPTVTLHDENDWPTTFVRSRTLNVHFQVTGEPIARYQISETSDFSSAVWQTNSQQMAWQFTGHHTLSYSDNGTGEHTVWIRIADADGVVSQTQSINFWLDDQAPPTPAITGVAAYYHYLGMVDVAWSFTDPGDVQRIQISTSPDFSSNMAELNIVGRPNDADVFMLNSPDPDQGSQKFYIRLRDYSGNYSPVVEKAFFFDSWMPAMRPGGQFRVNGKESWEFQKTASRVVRITSDFFDPEDAPLRSSGMDSIWISPDSNMGTCQEMPLARNLVGYATDVTYYLNTTDWPFDGSLSVYVAARDKAGNCTGAVLNTLEIDTVAPSIVSFIANQLQTADLDVDFAVTESGFAVAVQFAENAAFTANASEWQPLGFAVPYRLAAGSGTKTVYARVRDDVGNMSAPSNVSVLLDMEPPVPGSLVVNSGATETNSLTLSFDLSATETLSLPMEMQLSTNPSFGGATWEPYAATGTYQLTAGDGFRTVYVRFRDALGNVSAFSSASILVDTTAPQFSALTVNEGSAFADATARIDWSFSNWAAGDKLQVAEASDFTGMTEYAANAGANSIEHPLSAGDGPKTVYVRAKDALGNLTAGFQYAITRDTAPPTLVGKAVVVENDQDYVGNRIVNVDLNVTGAAQMMLALDPGFTGAVWEPFSMSTIWVLPAANASYTLYAKFRDQAQNLIGPYSDDVTLDTDPPSLPSVVINAGAAYATTMAVNLDLAAIGAVSMQVSNDGVFDLEPVVAYSTNDPAWPLSSGDGVKAVSVRFIDDAGNSSAVASDFIILDTVAPSAAAGGILINGGAVYTNDAGGNITLTLSSVGAYSVYLSEGVCGVGGSWQNYAVTVPFALSTTQGVHAVHARFRDEAGNVSACVSDSIVLDSVLYAPGFAASIQSAYPGKTSNPTISVVMAGLTTDVTEMQVANDSSFGSAAWIPTTTPLPWLLTVTDGLKNVYVRVRDAAGNLSAVQAPSVTLDMTPPDAPTIQVYDTNGDGFALSATNVELSWSAPAGADSFILQRLLLSKDLDYKTVAAFGAGVNTYSAAVTLPGYRHNYRIRAIDDVGNTSSWSTVAQAMPFEPLTTVYWTYDVNGYLYNFPPKPGTFNLRSTYYGTSPQGSNNVQLLPDNVTTWQHDGDYLGKRLDEKLTFKVANQDSSLVYEVDVPLMHRQREVIDVVPFSGTMVALAVDKADSSAHVAYIDGYDLNYATNKLGDWAFETVDSASNVMGFVSIDLDPSGYAHIGYYDNNSNEFLYAQNTLGSWTIETIDSGGYINALAVDASGYAHVVYGNGTDILYATNSGGGWTMDAIGTIGMDEHYVAIDVDSMGFAHVAFSENGTNELVYTSNWTGSWSSETVESFSSLAAGIDIKVDGNDKVHLAYPDGNVGGAKYAENTVGVWTIASVDGTSNFGSSSRIDVDIDNVPQIVFPSIGDWDIWHAQVDAGVWDANLVDSVGNINAVDFAIGSDGAQHFVYADFSTGKVKYLRQRAPFRAVDVDAVGRVGEHSSLAIAGDGAIHISYSDGGNSALKYATNASGAWATTTVHPGPSISVINSLALDSSGFAHIAFWNYGGAARDLMYATNKTGVWVNSVADGVGSEVGHSPSIAVDESGFVHIVYKETTSHILKYVTNETGSWVATFLEPLGGIDAQDTSIALDSANKVHLVYSTQDDVVRYATNKSGSWVYSTILANGEVDTERSIAIDTNDKVHVTYRDYGENALGYATNASGSWVNYTFDSGGWRSSIALDSEGKVHISYFEPSGLALKYATNVSGNWTLAKLIEMPGTTIEDTSVIVGADGQAHISFSDYGWPNSKLKYVTGFHGKVEASEVRLSSPY